MKHVLAARCAAAPSGMLASLVLAALSETGAKTAVATEAGHTIVDSPPGRGPELTLSLGTKKTPTAAIIHDARQPHAIAAVDMGRRPNLLRRSRHTLEQRGVNLGKLRRGGCIKLDD